MHQFAAKLRWVALAPLLLLHFSCDEDDQSSLNKSGEPSPNAKILPAPLVSARRLLPPAEGEFAGGPALGAQVPVATPSHFDPERALSDPRPLSDAQVWTLKGVWSWPWLAPRAGHGTRLVELQKLAQEVSFEVAIELRSSGKLSLEFRGEAFPLEVGTKLLARSDYWGHVLLWPAAHRYRLLTPGILRSMLLEARADVVPLAPVTLMQAEPGSRWGYETVRHQLTTAMGVLELDQAALESVGGAGALLCRLLLELIALEPASKVCEPGQVPLVAHYREAGQDMVFRVTELQRLTEPALNSLPVPPPGAQHTSRGLPLASRKLFVPTESLQALRPGAPLATFVLANQGSRLRYAAIQGVPIASVPPQSQLNVELPTGRYHFAWTDFFGVRDVQPPAPEVIDVPGRVELGPRLTPDAGVPGP